MKLAVEAYKQDHGEYPSSAGSARAGICTGPCPPSPVTGYDFEYQRTASRQAGVAGLEA